MMVRRNSRIKTGAPSAHLLSARHSRVRKSRVCWGGIDALNLLAQLKKQIS